MKKKIIAAVILALLGAGLHLGCSGSNDGHATAAPSGPEWCVGHQIAEANCPWCDPSLIEKLGMCPGHGVPEALCSRCNPALIPGFKAENDWCAGHEVPESQCLLCNPGLAEAAPAAPAAAEDTEVSLVSNEELLRRRRAPSVTCVTETLMVQFKSAAVAAQTGLEFESASPREITETISANAEISYDANRYARLASRAPGIVRTVAKDLGQTVKAGEVLAIIDSPGLGDAKAAYLNAQALVNLWTANHARETKLWEQQAGTEKDLLEAETRLAEAHIQQLNSAQRLRNLGIPAEALQDIAAKQDTSSLLPLTAPFAGMVVERKTVVGEAADTAKPLFAIADTGRMWAMVDVYETDIPRIKAGQPVILEIEALRKQRFGGRITWVSSQLERRTRTLKARAEIANPDGLLRDGMFAQAIISIHDKEEVLVVPRQAVQWEGCCNIVFVRKNDSLFTPRKVKLGLENGTYAVVEDGLKAGEEVVTTGSFLLKTEILKGSIGIGCCEVDPGKEK